MEQREIEILLKAGFKKPTSSESSNFDEYLHINPEYYYDVDFSVKGDHAFDAVEILYVENEEPKGLYYSSSLIDELYVSGYEKEITELFNTVKKYLERSFIHGNFVLKQKSDIVWFVIECEITEKWKLDVNVSQFTKAIAIIDYFAQEIEKEYNKRFDN